MTRSVVAERPYCDIGEAFDMELGLQPYMQRARWPR
jgi:hypothetical protein